MGEDGKRPTSDDEREGWKAYWASQGMPWRTEPEIKAERQTFLAMRRTVKPDVAKGIYPFRDERGSIGLARADIEWLLATHQSDGIVGPVDVDDKRQQMRIGPDLRGADLHEQNLTHLPLARLLAGLGLKVWMHTTRVEDQMASCNFERADLTMAELAEANLAVANFTDATLRQANLRRANLAGAFLGGAHLDDAHLELSVLNRAHLAGTYLTHAFLGGSDLRSAFFDAESTLRGAVMSDHANGAVIVADVRWRDVNLAVVNWTDERPWWKRLPKLGDESLASGRRSELLPNYLKEDSRAERYNAAVRANQQLSAVLRIQGLNEEAAHFAYRAHIIHRQVYLSRIQLLRYMGSWFLDLISGFGYRPLRSLVTYVVAILTFAALYWCVTNDISLTHGVFTQTLLWLGMTPPQPLTYHLQGYEAVVVSMTSFHGRGFQPTASPGDKVAILSAIEAAVGLLIEIVFIATFTQRFFAR